MNPFATGDVYMRQLYHCLQWYAGSKRVKLKKLVQHLFQVCLEWSQEKSELWQVFFHAISALAYSKYEHVLSQISRSDHSYSHQAFVKFVLAAVHRRTTLELVLTNPKNYFFFGFLLSFLFLNCLFLFIFIFSSDSDSDSLDELWMLVSACKRQE